MEKSTSFQGALSTLFNVYAKKTDPFIKLLDVFLVFLVFIGVVQFGYVVLVGTYPFNSFLSGFIAAVGQFVLTVSFRSQLIESSDPKLAKSAFSSKRAFLEYCISSLVFHFFVVNFLG
ncbi:oligosaccharyltransferase epsilon subunit [Schizosaccharomyces japonicus yFS275]|uniref:Dolichyl-diphosphooligosaccharide--protein glycosyltransferase subunit OST2 n=1 Tax=Schizosaccharomyces japonicus (strain yFS275 / FY16936) TaxID=402676 RepID=B6JXS8_SCHJY|nr:oligosaccharyltransferase epsilon subunit [Schizosaccharomyces japonicus yFS275]EEB06346.1 oligosaccharyltransferase epsilon subunit [Schizosaccharomyces japonicus yFS275]